ncbi:uncharacterized protein (DUF305 family) [Tamaricihabitans halophyticus]|uniref:Uncharacterized protein (DUF305 family) n=1 Tax=Tamaricihabitans halophyticus TaxID=1262583 RepID=A0A4R2Q391_9PSEU|nr:DUF305 domain-containing protein [Tamaricihabitans halophyticus]TCP41105.1 uncharacterized protein (DUF305 family) [Tamaricihabitans halophyticus]
MFRRVSARRALVGALAALGVALAGCGTGEDAEQQAPDATESSASAGKQFNDADIAFATEMIPHHRQAVQMAELAPDRAANPTLRELAKEIKGAQQPEIDTMSGWLRDWGEPVPSADQSGGGQHDGHGMAEGHGMPGMLTEDQLAELRGASGAEFDQLFARLMIEHHEGAVTMSKDQQKNGVNDAATKLAGEIIATQQAEITELRGMLGS